MISLQLFSRNSVNFLNLVTREHKMKALMEYKFLIAIEVLIKIIMYRIPLRNQTKMYKIEMPCSSFKSSTFPFNSSTSSFVIFITIILNLFSVFYKYVNTCLCIYECLIFSQCDSSGLFKIIQYSLFVPFSMKFLGYLPSTDALSCFSFMFVETVHMKVYFNVLI